MNYLDTALRIISTICLIFIATKVAEYEPPVTLGEYSSAVATGTAGELYKKIPLVRIK